MLKIGDEATKLAVEAMMKALIATNIQMRKTMISVTLSSMRTVDRFTKSDKSENPFMLTRKLTNTCVN